MRTFEATTPSTTLGFIVVITMDPPSSNDQLAQWTESPKIGQSALSHSGDRFMTVSAASQQLTVFDVAKLWENTPPRPSSQILNRAESTGSSIEAISFDCQKRMTACDSMGFVHIWDATGYRRGRPDTMPLGYSLKPGGTTYSSDGNWLVMMPKNLDGLVIDMSRFSNDVATVTYEELPSTSLLSSKSVAGSIALSRRNIVVGSGSKRLRLWNMRTGQQVSTKGSPFDEEICTFSASLSEDYLALKTKTKLIIWEVGTLEYKSSIEREPQAIRSHFGPVCFSAANESLLFSAERGTIAIWDIRANRRLGPLSFDAPHAWEIKQLQCSLSENVLSAVASSDSKREQILSLRCLTCDN